MKPDLSLVYGWLPLSKASISKNAFSLQLYIESCTIYHKRVHIAGAVVFVVVWYKLTLPIVETASQEQKIKRLF